MELFELNGIDGQFAELVIEAKDGLNKDVSLEWVKLRHDEDELSQSIENVQAAIAKHGPLPIISAQVEELDAKQRALIMQRRTLESMTTRTLELPDSIAELRSSLEEEFAKLAVSSFEFSDLMQQLVPEFHFYLVRLCDGGHLLPRAKVKLDLLGSIPDAQYAPRLKELLVRGITIDLFDPPQRERVRLAAKDMLIARKDQREIARTFPGYVTQAAVSKANRLQKRMIANASDDPYDLMLEPPADYRKLRRHKNAKYRFEPHDG